LKLSEQLTASIIRLIRVIITLMVEAVKFLRKVVQQILTDVSEDLTASIIRVMRMIVTLMMETVRSSSISVNTYQITRCNIPQDRHFYM
jgi:hypothetical protein